MFPFVIRKYVVDIKDHVLKLGLMLHQIIERLTATEFKDYEIELLEDLIIDYLDARKDIFAEYPLLGSPKSKTHFLTHYPVAVRLALWASTFLLDSKI